VKKPLDNIIVLDMTRVLAGPYCTMLLADLGARVIKVEKPGSGDDSREFGPFKNDLSAYFVSINREKESITVDLKKPEGIELIKRFVAKADVLVENFRPGTMEKLGLGYDELQKINPKLIYAASSGFGHSGPWQHKPCYDMIVQAMGGIMSITGWPDAPPARVGASIGDIIAGMFTAIGVNAALFQRTLTGKGQKVDVAMLDGQLAVLENALVRYFVDGKSPAPLGTRHPTITPFQAFQTSDSWIIVAVGNDKIWANFCKTLGIDELINDERFRTNPLRCENITELIPQLEKMFSQKTTEQWREILDNAQIPCTPICKIEDVIQNPQLEAREMFVKTEYPGIGELTIAGNPIKMSSFTETGRRRNAPQLGEQNETVLREFLGYTEEEYQELKAKKVI
jgi:CoA:oxalate CoA-transferase